MLNTQFDVVIIGSGPAGVSAAYPLIKAGLKVAIVDGGLEGVNKEEQLDNFSNINLTEKSNAYELFRNNSFIFNRTYRLLKIKSKIEIIQTLSKGGFSRFWHGISDFFTPSELKATGMPVDKMQREYREIVEKIKLQPKLPLDIHSELILQRAGGKTNLGSDVYTLPSATDFIKTLSVDVFKKSKNFTYIPNQLVYVIKNYSKFVEIQTKSIDKSLNTKFQARFLILAAGSINTTRILLRSFNLYNSATAFLTKAHFVIACLHLSTIFKKINFKKMKLGQLAISSQQTQQGVSKFFIQIFRFNPLAIHKASKYIPLPKFLAQMLLRIIAPSLVFADVRFPVFESKGKFLRLKKGLDNNDFLEIQFNETAEELRDHQNELRKIKQQLKILGLFPLKTGSDYITAHYGGGVPFNIKNKKLSVNKSGKLNNSKRIYIADSATWRALPGKSPTLTIMANASRIGKEVLKNFQ